MSTTDAGGPKAKIPTWDGASESFQAYQEAARLFEQTVEYKKRYLCGPQLQGALEGAAKRFVVGKPPAWLSFDGGVECLLDHLRQCLGRPQMPELTELLGKYFRGSKRRSGETMNEYISRKCEMYVRAQQAMGRVRPYHERQASSETSTWAGRWNRYEPQGRRFSTGSWPSTATEATEGEATEAPPVQAAAPTASDAGQTEDRQSDQGSATSWSWNDWHWSSSYWYDSSYGYRWNNWRPTTATNPPSLPDLVPEFIQAWLLLTDANLEASERNMILTAVQGDLTLQRVAQELRTQFPEGELRRREPARKHHGFWGEKPEESDEDEAPHSEVNFEAAEELNDEGLAMWTAAEGEVQSALATLHTAKRTLRSAREKQKQVRLNRQYYQGPGSRSGPSNKNDDHITCLRCGEVGHRAANCPASKPKEPSSGSKQMAPFVCYAEPQGVEEALHAEAESFDKATTAEAVRAGKAVVDCGATRSLGSVFALERVMELSKNVGSKVDLQNQPIFGFGNSTEDKCVSTLHLQLVIQLKTSV